MSLDLTTLRLMKYRARYERLARSVPLRALDPKIQIIFGDFGDFFREFPDVQVIDPGPFMLWFKGFKHPSLKDEACAVFDQLMREVVQDVPKELEQGLMKRLVAAATAYDVADMLAKFNEGQEIDLRSTLNAAVAEFDKLVDRKVKSPQVLDPIEDLLKLEDDDHGFTWRLNCINMHSKSLLPGDFVIIAARPDKGKTTFVISELTHMAAQVDKLFPGQERSILYLNNEGPGRRIVTRAFQAALNATIEDLQQKSAAGTIRQEYIAALGGRGGALRICDIHGMWDHEVEDVIRLYNPAIVLFDMIDNVKFGGGVVNGGQRTDQLLEAMYQWARLLAVKHDCVVMATSQISADGDGIQWPTQPMLKDSKTGKQGAADLIITMGAVNDPTLENSRYIGFTKSKKTRTGVSKSPNAEVFFDGSRARLRDW